jgi:hypothetical protein
MIKPTQKKNLRSPSTSRPDTSNQENNLYNAPIFKTKLDLDSFKNELNFEFNRGSKYLKSGGNSSTFCITDTLPKG